MPNFTHLRDLGVEGVAALLDRAARLKACRHRGDALAGRSFGMLFLNPSLRTRTSFELAMHRLGGHAVVLDVGQAVWAWEFDERAVMDGDRPEHVREAIGVLSRYVDALGVRVFARSRALAEEEEDPLLDAIRRAAGVPVISLESAREHPCQGLADLLTVRERHGRSTGVEFVLTWAPHIKALPRAVPNSALLTAAAAGCRVTVVAPPGFELSPPVLEEARRYAAQSGGAIHLTQDQDAAIARAQVIAVKSWGGNAEAASPDTAELRSWMLDQARLARLNRNASILHCLPVRRNVELAADVLDGPQSAVLDQAENRLWVQMAALEYLYGHGAPSA
jgi:N-acetylornithine carbamoyltransferase